MPYTAREMSQRSTRRDEMRTALHGRFVYLDNAHDKPYIPSQDLKAVMNRDAMRNIILEDQESLLWSADVDSSTKTEAFINMVEREASTLLATCVWVKVGMGCFAKLIAAGYRDSSLPLNDISPASQVCPVDAADVVRVQAIFNVHHFDNEKDQGEISRYVTVPVHFDRDSDLKGQGAYGAVYRVTIHKDHHHISSVGFLAQEYRGFPDVNCRRRKLLLRSRYSRGPQTGISKRRLQCYAPFRVTMTITLCLI